LREAARVRLLGLRERLEPLGDLAEPFLARLTGKPRVHLRILVGLARDRRGEILLAIADRLAGGGIAHLLEVLEVTVGVSGLTFGRVAEQAGDVGTALHVRLLREIEVAAVCLALARERGLEVLVRLGVLGIWHAGVLSLWRGHHATVSPASDWRTILDFGFAAPTPFLGAEAPEGASPRNESRPPRGRPWVFRLAPPC